MIKNEISAGGVVIAYINHQLNLLLLQDKTGRWTFPKGLIRNGEAKEKAAQREIEEEVGINALHLVTKLSSVEYFYRWEGNLTKKRVYYYLLTNCGTEKLQPQREEGILNVRWFPWSKAKTIIGYKKTNLPILTIAQRKIRQIKLSKVV